MPLSDHARWRVALRIVGAVVAVASAVVAIWLIARGDSTRQIQIGVIVGLWAALLGSATFVGTRRTVAGGEGLRSADLDRVVEASSLAARGVARQVAEDAARQAAEAATGQAVSALQDATAGRELERRRTAEVERERDEATRREFALSLELMLRREMERVLREELDALRQEVAGLRNDLTEKVPGQIRLERIETTRLIGSDLEALQAEVRRLAEERVALGGTPAPAITLGSIPADVRPAGVRPAPPRPPEVVAPGEFVTDPLEPAPPAADPWSTPTVSPGVTAPLPAPEEVREPAPEPAAAVEPVVEAAPEPEPAAPTPAAPTPAAPMRQADPFAGLPRLSRWVDPYADEPDAAREPAPSVTTGGHAAADTTEADDGPRYVGRRRQADGEVVHAVPDPEPTPAPTGHGRRHAREDVEEPAPRSGRRRRADDDDEPRGGHAKPELVPDDVLARLLGR